MIVNHCDQLCNYIYAHAISIFFWYLFLSILHFIFAASALLLGLGSLQTIADAICFTRPIASYSPCWGPAWTRQPHEGFAVLFIFLAGIVSVRSTQGLPWLFFLSKKKRQRCPWSATKENSNWQLCHVLRSPATRAPIPRGWTMVNLQSTSHDRQMWKETLTISRRQGWHSQVGS
jgi:hypothetical protein